MCFLLLGMLYMLLPATAAADTWNGSITGGFTGNFDPAQRSVSCMVVWNHDGSDQLYAGTENDNGCRVYHFDGGNHWSQVNSDGFGDGNNTRASSMAVYNGNLYVGTRNTSNGCQVWSYDGSSWTRRIIIGGFITANNVDASAMAVYGTSLYVGTENDPASGGNGCQVWRNIGGSLWAQANISGFGNVNNTRVSSLFWYSGQGRLIAGTQNTAAGCSIESYDGTGTNWTAMATDGISSSANYAATSLFACDLGSGTKLYAGTSNNGGCEVHSYTGALNPPHAWDAPIVTGGFGDGSNQTLACMTLYNDSGNKLFMGTQKGWGGCQVWTWDGSTTTHVGSDGFGDPLNTGAMAVTTLYGNLYFGTLNNPSNGPADRGTGAEVWQYNSGGPWQQINLNGFTESNNYMVSSMATLNNQVFAGTASATGCEVWRYNGTTWDLVNKDGFQIQDNSVASSMAVYDDGSGGGPKLYVGTYNPAGCQVWRRNGEGVTNWTRVSTVGPGIEGDGNRSVRSMTVYGGEGASKLYLGTYNPMGPGACEVWSFDGAAWTMMVGPGAPEPAGFGSNNQGASTVSAFDGGLYVGTQNWNGCEVWKFTPGLLPNPWQQSAGGGFGNNHNQEVSSMAFFNGILYAGTRNWNEGPVVYGHPAGAGDLNTWNQVSQYDFGSSTGNDLAASMSQADDRLFVGTEYGCQVWASYSPAQDNWSQANTDGWASPGNQSASAMTTRVEGLGSNLYVGTCNENNGAEVRDNVPSVDQVNPPVGIQGTTMDVDISGSDTHFTDGASTCTFSPPGGITVNSLDIHSKTFATANISIDDLATVGVRNVNILTPGETPSTLTSLFAVSAPGFASIASAKPNGCPQGATVNVDIVGNNTHFVQGQSTATFSGTGIKVNSTTVSDVLHARANITVGQGATVGARNVNVVTGTETPTTLRNGFSVSYGPKQAWYLAEGSTGAGFETWILVQNPSEGGATINITYMTPNGPVQGPAEQIGPGSRKTYNVADTVPNTDEVSTMVTSDRPVIAERSMYGNGRTWATDSIGVWSLATTWYLAEGCTGPGFDSWVLVQNPNAATTTVQLTYMTSHGQYAGPRVNMAANTRKSFKVNNTCPGEWQVSTVVSSTQPVVAERAIYGDNGAWATESIGASAPQTSWYLAEGSTGPGFETWVLVQNPGSKQANVKLTYMTGQGKKDGPSLKVPAGTRTTVNVADNLPNQWSVSTLVTSDAPVIAERAMYGNHRQWAHDSIGVSEPAATWCLAEGSTGPGFETWILVQNPNDSEAKVSLTYMTSDVSRPGPSVVLPAHSRKTFNVADTVGQVWEVSTKVSSDKPVTAERAMYGNGRVWGTDSIGCSW